MICRKSLALCVVVLATPLSATAQQPMHMPGMEMQDKKAGAFHPGLGDLMTAFVQPRHTKLGFAGAAANWPYAAYELDELSEAFDDVAKLVPRHGKLEIPAAIAATVKQPLEALDHAVKAKDQAAFTKAYAELTAGCNACHASAEHPMIVIQVPSVAGAAFPDQDFRPQK